MPPEKVIDRSAIGKIIFTDKSCRIAERSYPGIPALLWPEGFDEPVSDYLRYLVIDTGLDTESAGEYAKVLRQFARLCRMRGRGWQTIDDAFLRIWRTHQLEASSDGRTNYCLDIIFAFYVWAESTGRLRGHVGCYDLAERPDSGHGEFPISANMDRKANRRSQRWSSPLRIRTTDSTEGQRHTPTEHEIQKLHARVLAEANGVRNSLMLSWAEECGARVFEFLQITASLLPSMIELADLIERDEFWQINVVRKGRSTADEKRVGAFLVSPDLILRTLDYVENERRTIVERFGDRDFLFLSSTTGQVLKRDSVTHLIGRHMRALGIKKANIHRMRAKFAVRIVEELVDALEAGGLRLGSGPAAFEIVLTKAAERMNHMSPRSLRPYVGYVLNRRTQTSEADKAGKLSSRVRQLELREQTVLKRLEALGQAM